MKLCHLLALALIKLKPKQLIHLFPVLLLNLLRKPLDFHGKLQENYRKRLFQALFLSETLKNCEKLDKITLNAIMWSEYTLR